MSTYEMAGARFRERVAVVVQSELAVQIYVLKRSMELQSPGQAPVRLEQQWVVL